MKNRTKKILAIVGMGLVGMSLLTGCGSSDVSVNQADLEKTMSNANTYFENLNSSISDLQTYQMGDREYAIRCFDSLLFNGMIESAGNDGISYTVSQEYYKYNKLQDRLCSSYVAYWDGDTYKEYLKTDNEEYYNESVKIIDSETGEETYTLTEYSNDESGKTCIVSMGLDYLDTMYGFFFRSYSDLYDYLKYFMFATETADMYMIKIDGCLRFIVNISDGLSTIEFKNNKISKVEMYYLQEPKATTPDDFGVYYVETFEFNDTVESINFDKTGYESK